MQKWAIGIDLGGTKIETAIINADGHLLDRERVPTLSAQGPGKVMEQITNAVSALRSRHTDIEPAAIGIGVAGQIDRTSGNVVYAPNLEWHNFPLQQKLNDVLQLPVHVYNDVRAATYGEWKFGSGKGSRYMICIFVGTGIGSGIVSSANLVAGCNNTAGEIGHITIDMHGPLCNCGNRGCFEALAGGWAIARDAKAAVQKDEDAGKAILTLADGKINDITAETVGKALQQGDALSRSLMDNVAAALVAGTASVINMLGPCRIVFGGGIIEGMPALIDRIKEGVQKHALKAAVHSLEIVPAKLHNDAGVIGAAAFALELSDK